MNLDHRLGGRVIVLLLLGFLDPNGTAADRYVHRRSGLEPFRVERVAALPDGLFVTILERGFTREDRIPWDRIAAVDPDEAGRLEIGVESGLRLGDRIWRGIRRLQRGDARMARSAFEEASALEPRMPGELAATVLEGLVLAAIALDDTDAIMAEALLLGDLVEAGTRSDRFSGPGFSGDAIDRETGLVCDAPPVAPGIDVTELRRRLRELPMFHAASATRRDLWIRLLERSGPPDLEDRGLDEGTRLLLRLCELDADAEEVRTKARRRLLDSIDKEPAWKVAWIRWFAGSSAITHAGDDADAALLGVLDLVHVLALEDAAPSSLRRASLALAAETLTRIDRHDEAAILDSIITYENPGPRGPEITP